MNKEVMTVLRHIMPMPHFDTILIIIKIDDEDKGQDEWQGILQAMKSFTTKTVKA